MKNQKKEESTRRDFLRYGITVASGIVVPSVFTACGGDGGSNSSSSVDSRQTFVQPPVLEAKNGLLDLTLTALSLIHISEPTRPY